MAKMKYIDLKDKSLDELNTMLQEKKVLIFKLRNKLKTMQLKNTNEIKEARRDVARIKTAITALQKNSK